MKTIFSFMALALAVLSSAAVAGPELIIGEKRVAPGIVFIFEGAVKDRIVPKNLHLSEKQTDIHIEARANWDTKRIPKGTPPNGFVPYLRITALVINESTGQRSFVDLLPHINLVDNFHYARNMSLPGARSDSYRVIFNVLPPPLTDLALHRDWVKAYKTRLLKPKTFSFSGVNFQEIADATR